MEPLMTDPWHDIRNAIVQMKGLLRIYSGQLNRLDRGITQLIKTKADRIEEDESE